MEENTKTTMETPDMQEETIASENLADQEEGQEGNEEGSHELTALKTELELAKAVAKESNEQYMRLMAEFDNFRKRSRRETETLQEYASEKVLTAMLTVLDDFDRTLAVIEKTDNLSSIKDGIKMVTDKMHRVLEKEGLNLINAQHEDFDSGLHEAIHSVEVPDEKKGKVLEEVEKGYRLKDKVIRYSKVIVGE
jgi:molecular chaperone GrpE